MPISRIQMTYLQRHPAAMARYLLTGKAPQMANPSSPLISLLRSVSPHDRLAIRNVTVCPALGYTCRFTFPTAQQALQWVCPSPPVPMANLPAESYRNKQFAGPLFIDDLLDNSTAFPLNIAARYPMLRRPGQRIAKDRGARP